MSTLIAPADERRRLYQFTTDFNIGGTEGQMVTLLKGLNRGRFDVHLGCLRRAGAFLSEVQALRIPITEYRVRSFYRPETTAEQLRCARELRRLGVQIVHSYNFYANLFAVPAARLVGIPIVIAAVRDTGPYLTPFQRHANRLVCRMAHRVLVNAEAVRHWLTSQGVPDARISVIPNGIDLARFSDHPNPAVRTELGVPAQAPLIVMVSRLDRLKGIDAFLEAAARVVAEIPTARFVLAGGSLHATSGKVIADQTYPQELQEHMRRLRLEEHVTFAGMRRDVPAILAQASVSVLPSLSEGLSNTLLESMAAGVPVVATRVGGNSEVVAHGETGFLVPPRDPAALAEGILTLLRDAGQARTFGEAGRRRVSQRFSLERMIRDTELVYEELLEARRISSGRSHGRTTRPA